MIKRVSAWVAILMLLALFALPSFQASAAPAAQPAGAKFLTLPFTDSRIVVQQGWIYDWGSEHRGVDYVLGQRNGADWQSFDVVAAADGWACGNCTTRQGNAVWIKHNIDGVTYYTYYGHLASIEPAIPIGSQQNTVWVQRGQRIGLAGSTGSDSIHLHFQVSAPHVPIDPYDLHTTKGPYAPGCADCQMGSNYLWTTNPPSLPSGEQPVPSTPLPPPPPPPARTPVPPTATRVPPTNTPIPTPTRLPCKVDFEQIVDGQINDRTPEVRYCLDAAAGDWVSIRMFAAKRATLDTYLKLYAPDGRLLAADDDGAQLGANSFLVKQLPQTGTYQLVATRYSGTGQYKMRVEKGAKSALGDLNRDCAVNLADIEIMSAALGGREANADLNLDGAVDGEDHKALVFRLGRGCTPPGR